MDALLDLATAAAALPELQDAKVINAQGKGEFFPLKESNPIHSISKASNKSIGKGIIAEHKVKTEEFKPQEQEEEVREDASKTEKELDKGSSDEHDDKDDKEKQKDKRTFPMRLMEVLESVEENGISRTINWLPHGKAFMIFKIKAFTRKVLPRYFELKNFASFRRKLNRWGFKHVMKGPDAGAVFHKLFQRQSPQLCIDMKCQRTGAVKDSMDNDKELEMYVKNSSNVFDPNNTIRSLIENGNSKDASESDSSLAMKIENASPHRTEHGPTTYNSEDNNFVPKRSMMPRRVTMDMGGLMPTQAGIPQNLNNFHMGRRRRATMDMLGSSTGPSQSQSDQHTNMYGAEMATMLRLQNGLDIDFCADDKLPPTESMKRRRATMDMASSYTQPQPRRATMDMNVNVSNPNNVPQASAIPVIPGLPIIRRLPMARRSTMDMVDDKMQSFNIDPQDTPPRRATMDLNENSSNLLDKAPMINLGNNASMPPSLSALIRDDSHIHKSPNAIPRGGTRPPRRRATMDMCRTNTNSPPPSASVPPRSSAMPKRATMDMSAMSSVMANARPSHNRMLYERRQALIDMLQKEQAKQLAEEMIMAQEIYTTNQSAEQDERSRIIEEALDAAHRSGLQPNQFF